MPTVPTKIDQATLDRWVKEAKEWARTVKQSSSDTMVGVPVQGWCKSCDRDEPHEHVFSISK